MSTQCVVATAAELDALLERLLRRAEAVPVLRVTAGEIARMRQERERIAGNALAGAILHDAFMTLRVLRFLYSHRSRSQTADITTIAHAIMMLGQERFFREFQSLPVIEEQLGDAALETIRGLMSRSRLAALLARDWALQRHDIDPEEIMVAALLHDIPEMLLALSGEPVAIPAPARADMRARLFLRLDLPGLVAELNGEEPAHSVRIVNVRLACRLACHCYSGWPATEVSADLDEIQRFLRTSATQAWERVRKVVLFAAREWRYFQTLPAAAHLPFIAADAAESHWTSE